MTRVREFPKEAQAWSLPVPSCAHYVFMGRCGVMVHRPDTIGRNLPRTAPYNLACLPHTNLLTYTYIYSKPKAALRHPDYAPIRSVFKVMDAPSRPAPSTAKPPSTATTTIAPRGNSVSIPVYSWKLFTALRCCQSLE
ncbi:hypothetical protein E2C01_031910 [Portunus trituberculatus]|uniref:Uncharacterized protein n=1 Tax=Portunus trituberculatus TaxID=210409 RepID=A0A5B7EW11_PORTR|nr:hypothetical protein [Portunus trituberculatus]